MKVWLYIRDIYAEFPLSVIQNKGMKESNVFYGQAPYWMGQWAGEYRRVFQPEILHDFKDQKPNTINPSFLLKRIKRWKPREESFGGIFYDPDTNVVLGGDEKVLKFVRLIQKGIDVEMSVKQIGINDTELNCFYKSIWESYNAVA